VKLKLLSSDECANASLHICLTLKDTLHLHVIQQLQLDYYYYNYSNHSHANGAVQGVWTWACAHCWLLSQGRQHPDLSHV